MVSKGLLVSMAAGGLLLAQSQSANAGVDVDFGNPYYPAQYDSDYGYPSNQYDDDYDDDYDRISCWEGRRIVRRAGFRDVRSITCYGEIYRYRGWRRGHQWRIAVDSDTGRIIRARPIYY
jgi:hypothetical protein